MRTSTAPTHTLGFQEQIQCFEICGSEFASSLVCIAGEKKLKLGVIRFPEETEIGEFTWERMKDIYHESRCHAICFLPETSLIIIPNVVFCAAGSDFNLRIYRTNLQDNDTVQTIKGHTNYVNDIAWSYSSDYLASVSDDYTCKIWSTSAGYECVTNFCLSSAGMSVKWHKEETQKLLVAEKKGVIHIYNIVSQQAIISLDTPKYPLMSADWSLNNRLYVTALAAGEIIIWDLRRPCTPMDIKQVHEDGGRIVRFLPNSETVIASIGRPDLTLKVFTAKSNVPLIEAPLKLYGKLAWHHRLPYIAAASDRKLCFWKVQVK